MVKCLKRIKPLIPPMSSYNPQSSNHFFPSKDTT
jgi:hypothetical protein